MGSSPNEKFTAIVDEITSVGLNVHKNTLVEHARSNAPYVKRSIKQLPALTGSKLESAIVISAGPSVHRRSTLKRIFDAGYKGTLVAVDGAYIACLKAGLIPDYVLTLDPHPKRMVRWFGDPDFEKNSFGDDYFARQDLDLDFRKNSIAQNKGHIKLVDDHAKSGTMMIVASSAPRNVVERLSQAGYDMYWWNPLVDNPRDQGSITRQIYDINGLPCLNTGGTVGTAAWVFTHSILKISEIALTGMDLGYYADVPREKTQTFYELHHHIKEGEIDSCFVDFEFPLTGEKFYTDPTYFWYRRNFLELFLLSKSRTVNCTEGGTLFDERLKCTTLDDFLEKHQ